MPVCLLWKNVYLDTVLVFNQVLFFAVELCEFLYPDSSVVKNPPAMQETPVQFLGREDPLEKGQATHSSMLGLPL